MRCSNCGRLLSADDVITRRCPECRTGFVLPGPGSDANPEPLARLTTASAHAGRAETHRSLAGRAPAAVDEAEPSLLSIVLHDLADLD